MISDSAALPYILRAEDVAAVLRISRSQAYALLHAEGFPTIHLPNSKALRVRRDDLLEYLAQQTNPGGDGP